jgi:epoxyqueuosine reductase
MNAQGYRNDQLELARQIKTRGQELGFQKVGITDVDLREAEQHLERWLADNKHGEMSYMSAHGRKRSRPQLLVPGTLSIISVRYDYFPPGDDPQGILKQETLGYISRYALGRDYHKVLRARLKLLAQWIEQQAEAHGYRIFVDSAPVLEKPIAQKAGLGWVGKHSNLLSRDAGSWFFLGEIYTDIPLPSDLPSQNHCGSCDRCVEICPTRAITAPYVLDARRCISYLTIELQGAIPAELRPLMGNRIYGCDDCLLVCPWNRFARPTSDADFLPRHGLDSPELLALFDWSESQFRQRLEGSPIRRLGHDRWLRNIAVALGNAPPSSRMRAALEAQMGHPSELVREHVAWALERQGGSVNRCQLRRNH